MSTDRPGPARAQRRKGRALLPRTLPREEWPMVLGFAGVWLVFLLMAVASATVARVQADDPAGAAVSVGCGLAFAAVYLGSFIAPDAVPSWPRPANTVLYTLALGLVTAVFASFAGAAALNVIPYFGALWIFSQTRRTALTAAAVIAAAGMAMTLAFTEGEQRIWLTVSVLLATGVIMGVRLAADGDDSLQAVRRELALSRQREELARDVHDVLGHSLTAVHVKAQLVARLIEADPARARDEAEQIIALTRTAIGEVRSTVDGLTAPQLATELAGARRVLSDAGLRADVPGVEAAAEVPAPAAEVFAWTLREAVTNTVRHAGADHVRITLAPDRLTVVDDGIGPDGPVPAGGPAEVREPSSPRRRGTGLDGLRARAEAAGGTLVVRPEHPGADRPGTRVEVTL
jgi:two-component system, NarL family, sensor histidine kinase DesK